LESWPELLMRQRDDVGKSSDTTNVRNEMRQDVVSEPPVSYLLKRSSLKEGGNTPPKPPPAAPTALACVSPPGQADPTAAELVAVLAVFRDFGRGCSRYDRVRCERLWRQLTPEDRRAVGTNLQDCILAWRERPTDKIPQPWNYLGGRYWERMIPRHQPQREMGTWERGFRRAAANFIRKTSGAMA
jgi:hypothetical protein